MNYQNELTDLIVLSKDADLVGIIPGGKIKTPTEALEIHRHGYVSSLARAMQSTFTEAARVLGESTFHDLVLDYILENPSQTHNINFYGRRFPKFLEDRGLPIFSDLAQLELNYDDLFRLKQHTPVQPQKFHILEENPECKIRLASTLILFQSKYSVYDLWAGTVKEATDVPSYIIMYKKNKKPHVTTLTELQFQLVLGLRRTQILARSLPENITPESVQNLFHLLSVEGLIEDITQ